MESKHRKFYPDLYHFLSLKKFEPYLTFLNFPQLERQGADLQTQVAELQDINQVLREKDKMKMLLLIYQIN